MIEYAIENMEFAPTKQLLALSTHQAFLAHRMRKLVHDSSWFGKRIDLTEGTSLLAQLKDMNFRYFRPYFWVMEQRISSLKADDYISIFRTLFYAGIAEGCLNDTILSLLTGFKAKNDADSDLAKVAERKSEVMFSFARLKISENDLA